MQFNFESGKINDSIIGEITYKNYFKKFENNEIRETIKSGNIEKFQLDHTPYDMCVLKNNTNLLVIHDNSLSLYNEFLNLLKSVDKIDGKNFKPAAIVSNNDNEIFISDWEEHQIIKIDMNFNKIKSYNSFGSGDNDLARPWSLSFNNNILYVCDFKNKALKLFDNNLEFTQSVKLNYLPWMMKVSDSTVCINAYVVYNTFFYSKADYTLVYFYNHQQCRINEINSCFYGYSYKTNEVFCYDDKGLFIESLSLIDQIDETDSHCDDGCIMLFDTGLAISFFKKKMIIKFKRN